jgi:hypothetical protein
MRKRICTPVIFCLILVLFAACSASPTEELDAFTEKLSRLETYAFTAVGELTFENGLDTGHTPLRYVMEGTRSTETGQFALTLYYTDQENRLLFDLSLLESGGVTYVYFVPLFQRLMDLEYAEYDTADLAEAFHGRSYFTHPALDLSHLLTDLPALIGSLEPEVIEDGFAADQGIYTLRFTADHLETAALTGLFRPFELFFDMQAIALPGGGATGPNMLYAPLLSANREQITLDLVFTYEEEAGAFTIWLTLHAPGLLTLTADVTYHEAPVAPLAPPEDALEIAQMHELLEEYRITREIRRAIEGLEIVPDLPELHMVNHPLGTDILEHLDMEIGGQTFQVSVIANANHTVTDDMVFSYSLRSMTLLYTTLDARSASETMGPFVLIDLDPDDFDADSFHRTPMRVNAHDSAAVKALYFDDNLMGRTLHIYVLQNIAGTDQALFLGIIVIMDNISPLGHQVLDQLGFYIGINFQEYLELASE